MAPLRLGESPPPPLPLSGFAMQSSAMESRGAPGRAVYAAEPADLGLGFGMRRALRPVDGVTADLRRLPGFMLGELSLSSASSVWSVSSTMSSHCAAASGFFSGTLVCVSPSCSTASSSSTSSTPISPVCITSSRMPAAGLSTRLLRHSSAASSRQPTEPWPAQRVAIESAVWEFMSVSRDVRSSDAMGNTPPWFTMFCACSGFFAMRASTLSTPVASDTEFTLGSSMCLSMNSISTMAGRMLLRSGAGVMLSASICTTLMASSARRMRPLPAELPAPVGTSSRDTAFRPLPSSGARGFMKGARCAKQRSVSMMSSGCGVPAAASISISTTCAAAPASSAPRARACRDDVAAWLLLVTGRTSASRMRSAAICRSWCWCRPRARSAVVSTPPLKAALRKPPYSLAKSSSSRPKPSWPTVAIQVTGSSPLTSRTAPPSEPSASKHISVTVSRARPPSSPPRPMPISRLVAATLASVVVAFASGCTAAYTRPLTLGLGLDARACSISAAAAWLLELVLVSSDSVKVIMPL
mmetsp:Transcript_30380/g.96935  ORF Transcript_30380/g.96935 Transcript_30380/m.96935 type:complete len:527 (+) Transcript_30380:1384-2964(+)